MLRYENLRRHDRAATKSGHQLSGHSPFSTIRYDLSAAFREQRRTISVKRREGERAFVQRTRSAPLFRLLSRCVTSQSSQPRAGSLRQLTKGTLQALKYRPSAAMSISTPAESSYIHAGIRIVLAQCSPLDELRTASDSTRRSCGFPKEEVHSVPSDNSQAACSESQLGQQSRTPVRGGLFGSVSTILWRFPVPNRSRNCLQAGANGDVGTSRYHPRRGHQVHREIPIQE